MFQTTNQITIYTKHVFSMILSDSIQDFQALDVPTSTNNLQLAGPASRDHKSCSRPPLSNYSKYVDKPGYASKKTRLNHTME